MHIVSQTFVTSDQLTKNIKPMFFGYLPMYVTYAKLLAHVSDHVQ